MGINIGPTVCWVQEEGSMVDEWSYGSINVQYQHSCYSDSPHVILLFNQFLDFRVDPPGLLLEFEWTKEAFFWDWFLVGVATFLVNFSGFLVMGGGVGWEPSHMFSWVN